MTFYNIDANSVIEALKSDGVQGLSPEEAAKRLDEYGKNKLKEKPKKSNLLRFAEQFKDTMIIILLLAALISFVIAFTENNTKAFFEPGLILLIVIVNAIMGVMQENKAERALEALSNLNAPHAKVVRGGKESNIEAADLVPGDIIKLDAGDFVPADSRLIRSTGLKCEESALTGESVPSDKNAEYICDESAPLGDRFNMVYSGTSVSYGTAYAVVCHTGMDTEMGKIANMLDNEEQGQTPLQEKLATLGKYLGFAAIFACLIVFIIGILNNIPVLEIFMISVSLAVSAIPEGLPAIITIVLSIGVQRLASKNSIIRRLPAVEALGSASIICSDKTGTLTQNKMTVTEVYSSSIDKTEEASEQNSWAVRKLLNYATLCTDSSLVIDEDGAEEHIGDTTETAIIRAAYQNGFSREDLINNYKRVASIPFDSDRKLMCTVNDIDGQLTVIVKGAFDMLAERCSSGNVELGKQVNSEMSNKALRVIAVAYKEIDEIPDDISSDNLENGLHFLGLIGMIDPPREEVKEAVKLCKQAGITPIMITGDHIATASAIAKELGILNDDDRAITGIELDNMSDKELDANLEHIRVYARVSPANKIRIVKAWQRKGKSVAMTGDGVNDAPALKAADIGCAMGITGTDVAKGAADMVLVDDNFATIVTAVREGRGIYDNIKKVVGFLLGTNIGEILTVFVAMLLWHKSPLVSLQLLWINLVTDGLPAVALGMEKIESDVMSRKPVPKGESIFAHGFGLQIILQGIMFGGLSLLAFVLGEKLGGSIDAGRTLTFIVLAQMQLVQSYNMRSHKSLFEVGFFTNPYLNKACLLSFALILVVLFTPLRVPFSLSLLSVELYALGVGISFIPLIVMELGKFIMKEQGKDLY